MATSLYDLSVPTFLQTVSAVAGFLDRAARYCAETAADPDDFVHARLFADMAPFHFQIEALAHHSVWGLEAVRTGVFAPPALVGPIPYVDLQTMIGQAETALKALTADEVNSWAGKDLDLQIGPRRLAFTPETFILSGSARTRLGRACNSPQWTRAGERGRASSAGGSATATATRRVSADADSAGARHMVGGSASLRDRCAATAGDPLVGAGMTARRRGGGNLADTRERETRTRRRSPTAIRSRTNSRGRSSSRAPATPPFQN
jgi:hypothetical protein